MVLNFTPERQPEKPGVLYLWISRSITPVSTQHREGGVNQCPGHLLTFLHETRIGNGSREFSWREREQDWRGTFHCSREHAVADRGGVGGGSEPWPLGIGRRGALAGPFSVLIVQHDFIATRRWGVLMQALAPECQRPIACHWKHGAQPKIS